MVLLSNIVCLVVYERCCCQISYSSSSMNGVVVKHCMSSSRMNGVAVKYRILCMVV